MRWLTALLSVACVALVAPPLGAAEFPSTALLSIGFREVRLDDVRDGSEFAKRLGVPSGYLSVSTDFNGDGKSDEARILQNSDRQIAYVVVVTLSADKVDTYVIKSLPLSDVPHLAIIATPLDHGIVGERATPGLAIFDLRSGKGEASYFDGEDFNIQRPFVFGR